MNERIKELARTSHLDVYGLGKDRTKWEDSLEKFTELLVNEVLRLQREGTDVANYFGTAPAPAMEGIDLDFSDEELLQYMKLAHEQDITFNKFVENALRAAIDATGVEDEITTAS